MKTKWQVWAHLLCTNYSISALKKITKWLKSKGIIELEWKDVCVDNSHKGEKRDMTYFMAWYNDDSPTCATYPRLASQIKSLYDAMFWKFQRSAIYEIKEHYEVDRMDTLTPF